MAWLPQIAENERQEWRERANRRIRFLESFSERWRPKVGADTTQPTVIPTNEIRLSSANALTQAAELALASDQTPRGWELMNSALDYLLEGTEDSWPIVRTALLGALLTTISTSLSRSGVALKHNSGRKREVSWNGSATAWERAVGQLIAAAVAYGSLNVAYGSLNDAFPLLLDSFPDAEFRAASLAFLLAANALETDTLPAFGFRRRSDGGLEGPLLDRPDQAQLNIAISAFLVLHQRFAARLRLLASDSAHWRDELRPRAPLIDWALLALHVALFRLRTAPGQMQDQIGPQNQIVVQIVAQTRGTPSSEIVDFVLSAAHDLAGYSPLHAR